MSEIAQITDSAGGQFSLQVSTADFIRLSFLLAQAGNSQPFRPKYWGGEWSAMDCGSISPTGGEVWYQRNSGDMSDDGQVSDVQRLDVLLCSGENADPSTYGIRLYRFLSLNSLATGVADGFLAQSWVLQAQPGSVTWEVSSRVISR
jgi:hypothetical protein